MSRLALEYQGFLKFINRAKSEIKAWFGPYCNNDPNKITFMAAREWDVMGNQERKYFIKSHIFDKLEEPDRVPRDVNPYFNYLLHKRHINIPSVRSPEIVPNIIKSDTDELTETFNPFLSKMHARQWHELPQEERDKYFGIKMTELSMIHVIDRRDKLHKLYKPNELAILEFIIKTKPKKPTNARTWFLIQENVAIQKDETIEKWSKITEEDKRFYEVCAEIDRKRFFFEKNLWLTRLLQIDLDNPDFRSFDFQSERAKSDIENFNSIIGANRNLIPGPKIKRPLGPFSLFLKDHRERTRKTTKQFVFGKHLKDSGAEWFKLTDKERQCYYEASAKLREAHLEKLNSQKSGSSNQELQFDLSNVLFRKPDLMNEPHRIPHLITTKKQSPLQLFAKHIDLPKYKAEQKWNELCPADKEPYVRESDSLKTARQKEKAELKEKLLLIKDLIKKAKELEKLKIKMLLKSPNKR